MAKQKKPKKKGKLLPSIIVIIVAVIILSAFGNKSKTDKTDNVNKSETEARKEVEIQKESETTVKEENIAEKEESGEILFEDDEGVNSFIVKYNSISGSPLVDLEKGNTRNKCYGHTYERYAEIVNGADGTIYFTVNADFENPEIADLRDAFKDGVLTLDSSVSEEDAYSAFDKALEDENYRTDQAIGNVTYTIYQTVELSKGKSFGRFDLSCPMQKE